MLEEHMYLPFQEETGTEVIPFDSRGSRPVGAHRRHGAQRQHRIRHRHRDRARFWSTRRTSWLDIPCAEMPSVVEYALDGACESKGVARTTGGNGADLQFGGLCRRGPRRTGPTSGTSNASLDRAACPTPATATGGSRPLHCWRNGVAKEDLFPDGPRPRLCQAGRNPPPHRRLVEDRQPGAADHARQ